MTGMELVEQVAGRHPSGGRDGGPLAFARPVGTAGFTLMEMLVTLVLISFATMLMFQMLGSYRVARERVQAQSGVIDRRALFQSWMQDSVRGLYITNGLTFAGDARGHGADHRPVQRQQVLVQLRFVQQGHQNSLGAGAKGKGPSQVRPSRNTRVRGVWSCPVA